MGMWTCEESLEYISLEEYKLVETINN